MLLVIVTVTAIFFPSGEKLAVYVPPGGRTRFRSAPVDMSLSARRVGPFSTRGPLVRGLMRDPASPWKGADTSAMVAMLRRWESSITVRSGDIETPGSGAASMMSAMTFGGVR